MTFLNKYKNLLLLALGSLLLLAIIFFVLIPQYDQLMANYNDNKKEIIVIEDLRSKIRSLENLNKKSSEVDSKILFASNQIPDNTDATLFASYLEQLGRKISITPLTVSVVSANANAKPQDGLIPIGYNLTFTSSFPTLKQFLLELQKMERLNTINTLSVTEAQNQLNITINGNIYQVGKK